MKSIKLIAFMAVAIAAVLMIWTTFSQNSTAANASAGWDCNQQNISGNYAYAAFGEVVGQNALGTPIGPFNSAATSYLDGKGNYTITPTTFVNGTLIQDGTQTLSGVYTVGPDCVVHFYDESAQLELVRTYGTAGHTTVQGVSMLAGTNITYLITRK
jgi:hypothetical protein